jgi:hypothetical protein
MARRKQKRVLNIRMSTSLPPSQAVLIKEMVGTIYGETKSEVIRFITTAWLTENLQNVMGWIDKRVEHNRSEENKK